VTITIYDIVSYVLTSTRVIWRLKNDLRRYRNLSKARTSNTFHFKQHTIMNKDTSYSKTCRLGFEVLARIGQGLCHR